MLRRPNFVTHLSLPVLTSFRIVGARFLYHARGRHVCMLLAAATCIPVQVHIIIWHSFQGNTRIDGRPYGRQWWWGGGRQSARRRPPPQQWTKPALWLDNQSAHCDWPKQFTSIKAYKKQNEHRTVFILTVEAMHALTIVRTLTFSHFCTVEQVCATCRCQRENACIYDCRKDMRLLVSKRHGFTS